MPRQGQAEKPWERRKGEGEKPFAAFCVYRDMGAKRSVLAVVTQLSKSRQLITRWKSTWHWDDRARAYDNDLEKQAQKQKHVSVQEMTDRHIRLSMQLQAKAIEALKNLDTADMSPRDIKEYIKMAAELERMSRLTQVAESANGAGGSLAETVIAAYEKRRGGDGDVE
jgi:hypothetical protein